MNYRSRSNHYVFTVTNIPEAEQFFKELCRANQQVGPGHLFRMGRNRNRVGIEKHIRKQGRLPLDLSDRWDVYCKIQPGSVYRDRVDLFIREANPIIRKYRHLIEYANRSHILLFENIFNTPDKTIEHKVTEIMKPIYNPNYTTWNVKLSATVRCVGAGVVLDVEHFFKNVSGLSEVVLIDVVPIDEHKDLPLVSFKYNDYSEPRSIRVTKMDDTYLEGYEKQQFKKFRVDSIIGAVQLVELPIKQ